MLLFTIKIQTTMGRSRIRLTESQLRRIVEESVYRILDEGQGWNKFKTGMRDLRKGEFDSQMDADSYFSDFRNDAKRYIKNGSIYDDGGYYDEDGDAYSSNDSEGSRKPIDRSLGGRLGRAAAVAGLYGASRARQLGNKFRRK